MQKKEAFWGSLYPEETSRNSFFNRDTQMMEDSIFVKDKLTKVSKKSKQNNMVMVYKKLGLVKWLTYVWRRNKNMVIDILYKIE